MAKLAHYYGGFTAKLLDPSPQVSKAYTVIYGTEGDDKAFDGLFFIPTVFGTPDNNIVYLLGGDDSYTADWANVDLFSKDIIFGGFGNDGLKGHENVPNKIYGQAGNDIISGGRLNDFLSGGDNDDYLQGLESDDILDGGSGEDTLFGWTGDDTLYGGTHRDILHGEADHDTLFGGTGNDDLFGGGQNDVLNGDDGNDRLEGGPGNDTVIGGADNDAIFMNVATDGTDEIKGFETSVLPDFVTDTLTLDFSGLGFSVNLELQNTAHLDLADEYVGLVYDTTHHDLWYDNGQESAFHLAHMDNQVQILGIADQSGDVVTLVSFGPFEP